MGFWERFQLTLTSIFGKALNVLHEPQLALQVLGPAKLSFASAPFWALAHSPDAESAQALLSVLVRPEALRRKKLLGCWSCSGTKADF